ncbi:UNVERIFIED_CONTAM: hypothetical protein HDU68_000756 [Siphonaria sp. JEL0065]|nr:hypothetical protein HDU68_000756 [Siphonaria sp. JEL0065]
MAAVVAGGAGGLAAGDMTVAAVEACIRLLGRKNALAADNNAVRDLDKNFEVALVDADYVVGEEAESIHCTLEQDVVAVVVVHARDIDIVDVNAPVVPFLDGLGEVEVVLRGDNSVNAVDVVDIVVGDTIAVDTVEVAVATDHSDTAVVQECATHVENVGMVQ